uniref:F-box domain-containing protein n=1 Tax=Anopheles minimus TaxID=112268 RepID=A0A182W7Z6_9DIPT
MEQISIDKAKSESDFPSSSHVSDLPQQKSEQGRKRKLSTGLDNATVEPDAKYQLIEAANSSSNTTEPPWPTLNVNMLDLSDEILLLIFQHLDSNSLLLLSKACSRLQGLVADKTLWMVADFTSTKLTTAEVRQRISYLQPATTKTLKVRGMTSVYPAEMWNVPTLTVGILQTVATRCTLLERLELTEAYLDMNKINIIMFPHTLRSLVFRKCALSVQNVSNQFVLPHQQMRSFLSNMYKYLVRLEELTIEYCAWFDTHDLMVLSKLPNLRYLSLKGCANIKDSVPYASIATRFGFKKLEILDLRDTPISDSDVSCFNIVHSLKELRLECPEHLRTETGLNEYNEAERQRVEQLHRLAMPDLLQNDDADRPADDGVVDQINAQNEPPPEGGQLPPPIPRPRHGVFEIRIIHGDYPGYVRGNQDNLIRIVRDPQQPIANIRAEAGRVLPIVNENNRQDRQNIVRIINRDLLLQRRENVLPNHPHRLLRRHADQMQINAAYQRIFDAGGNPAQRPRPEPRPDRPDDGPLVGNQLPAEPVLEQRDVNLRLHDGANNPAQDRQEEQPQQQPAPQNNAPAPQRVLPHVIIMPGNFQELIHRPGNGNQHQIFVNLGIGQPAPNYVSLVSDRGICAYGVSRNELAGALMDEILNHNLTGLERLSIRNYKLVTDTSLDHLESAAPQLKLLDVTGTSVTAQGIRNFKLSRPGCVVISDHDKTGNESKSGVVNSDAVSLDRLNE